MGEITGYKYCDYPVDNSRMEMGNFYRTKEEARFELEKQKTITALKKYSFEPDWEDKKQDKWFLYYAGCVGNPNMYDIRLGVSSDINFLNQIYFESSEKCKEAIKAIGEERIKKYFFETRKDVDCTKKEK